MANRILCDEFKQCGIPKIVSTFKDDVLMHKIRMLIQVRPQTSHIAGIDEFHGATKRCVFNALMMRQFQWIRERGFCNVRFQSRPARKSILASDGELCITKA